MATDPITARYEHAKKVTREAGQIALELFKVRETLDVDHKGLQDRVSIADRKVELTIRRGIASLFPDDGFIGEELGVDEQAPDERAGTWVIDPIDGTDCFLFGIPAWSVSLAWLQGNETRIGIVYDPVHDELFSARSGGGAFINDTRLKIPEAVGSQSGLVGIGHSTRIDPDLTLTALNHLFALGGLFHRCGSGALSLAWVAAGRLIAYYEPHMNAWDCLAGLLLVREAGGWTNDFLGGDALASGNLAAAAAPGMIDQIKVIGGLERPRSDQAARRLAGD